MGFLPEDLAFPGNAFLGKLLGIPVGILMAVSVPQGMPSPKKLPGIPEQP